MSEAGVFGVVAERLLLQQVGIAAYDRQNIIEIMGNAAGKLADGIEPLGMAQLFRQESLIGDIRDHGLLGNSSVTVIDG